MKTEVVNIDVSDYDVYIGRSSKWGNPFIVGQDGNRAHVLAKYKVYIASHQGLLRSLGELWGKKLGCHCKPLPCHGDILVELVKAWSKEAFKCAHKHDGFCDTQIVKLLASGGHLIHELDAVVEGMREQYPCMFKAHIVEGLGTHNHRVCKTCGNKEFPHNFRHPFVPED